MRGCGGPDSFGSRGGSSASCGCGRRGGNELHSTKTSARAQSERRSDARPVRVLLGGGPHRPLSFLPSNESSFWAGRITPGREWAVGGGAPQIDEPGASVTRELIQLG